MAGGLESGRSILHLADLIESANAIGLFPRSGPRRGARLRLLPRPGGVARMDTATAPGPSSRSMADLRCLVIGAASGIGASTAARLHGRVGMVIGADLAQPNGAGFDAPYPTVTIDVADPKSVQNAVGETLALTGGGLDVVVNTAGILGRVRPSQDESVADFERLLRINLVGAFLVSTAVLPIMAAQQFGRLVHFSDRREGRGGRDDRLFGQQGGSDGPGQGPGQGVRGQRRHRQRHRPRQGPRRRSSVPNRRRARTCSGSRWAGSAPSRRQRRWSSMSCHPMPRTQPVFAQRPLRRTCQLLADLSPERCPAIRTR